LSYYDQSTRADASVDAPHPISRRALIGGALSTATLAAAPARAEWNCYPADYYGNQRCSAGIPFPQMQQISQSSAQRMENWCWAACISLVFRRYGRFVSQETIVNRVFGAQIDQPLAGHLIAQATSSMWRDQNGHYFQPMVNVLIDSNFNLQNSNAGNIAIQNMMASRPMIVGTNRHAMVVSAIDFTRDGYGQRSINNVRVRDPWPLSPSARNLSSDEYYSTQFLMEVYL